MPTPDELILALICAQPQHGYAVAEVFANREVLGYVWNMGASQVYKVLKRLEASGLIKGTTVAGTTAPNRTVYQITENGRAVVDEWLDDPDPASSIRYVRVVFLSRMYAAQILHRPVADIVDLQIEVCRMERNRVADLYANAHSEVARWALSLQLTQVDAVLEWLSRFVPNALDS